MTSEERELLAQVLGILELCFDESVESDPNLVAWLAPQRMEEIRNYLATAPVDEVYAHYDANGQRTRDPDQIRSTLLVRKIS